jgi:hypothetical protein
VWRMYDGSTPDKKTLFLSPKNDGTIPDSCWVDDCGGTGLPVIDTDDNDMDSITSSQEDVGSGSGTRRAKTDRFVKDLTNLTFDCEYHGDVGDCRAAV